MVRLVTPEGYNKILEELNERKSAVRQAIAKEIKEAKEQGDLSENAEYSEAKSKQAENEARIAELEMLFKDSQVVEASDKAGTVGLGSKVKAKFNGSEIDFQIVGSNEADPSNFKISNESPMGKSFLGRKKGESVEAQAPAGRIKYKILEVN